MKGRFYGKYRGVVTRTDDPLRIGRLRAMVTDVTSKKEVGWAMPCAPFAGEKVGLFAVPTVGARVWIEFEQGDPDYPIWSGCFWEKDSERPDAVKSAPDKAVVLRTAAGHSIVFDDNDGGGITLETATGQKVVISANGIEIDDGKKGKISLSGGRVTVNDGALEVI
jgi:uncharacterized protein involved in type VI secretion and phage assembly